MIQARFLQRSSHRLKNSYTQLAIPPTPSRNFSSNFARATPISQTPRHSLSRSQAPWQYRQWSLRCLTGPLAPRFASTATNTTPIADFQPEYAPPPESSAPAGEGFLPTSLDGITDSMPPVYEHIGFLKEMGLDYGWGTTAFMEWLLEHVHIYAGTPWWLSITISMLIIRAGLLKLYFDAADSNARSQLIAEHMAPLMKQYQGALGAGNRIEAQRIGAEMKRLRRNAGVNLIKQFAPFVQVPIGFGTFRLMRGMAYLPAPGLDTGGLLWFSDLTLSDPLFILPVATAAVYATTFKMGGETGSSSNPMSPAMQKTFLYVIPPFSGLIMVGWPAALQLTFFITAMISFIQTNVLKQAWFRNLIGIQPLPQHLNIKKTDKSTYTGTMTRYQAPRNAPKQKKGGAILDVKNNLSEWFQQGKKKVEERTQPQKTGRRTAAELKHAKEYNERRERELKQESEARRLEREENERERRGRQRH